VPTDAVHNAKLQLTATLINNVAAAYIVAGFVAPVVNGQFTSADVLWIIIGVALHAAGRISLGSIT
jgi:hypothetical protein